MSAFIYLANKEGIGFGEAVKLAFRELNVDIKETRFSDNYMNGYYLTGEALGIKIKACEMDDLEFPGYGIGFIFSPATREPNIQSDAIDGLADMIARYFAGKGWPAARSLGHKVGDPVLFYEGNTVIERR